MYKITYTIYQLELKHMLTVTLKIVRDQIWTTDARVCPYLIKTSAQHLYCKDISWT